MMAIRTSITKTQGSDSPCLAGGRREVIISCYSEPGGGSQDGVVSMTRVCLTRNMVPKNRSGMSSK